MFLALGDELQDVEPREADAIGDRIFARYSLVPDIQRHQVVGPGMTDNAGEEKGGRIECEIGVVLPVAGVPEEGGPG